MTFSYQIVSHLTSARHDCGCLGMVFNYMGPCTVYEALPKNN